MVGMPTIHTSVPRIDTQYTPDSSFSIMQILCPGGLSHWVPATLGETWAALPDPSFGPAQLWPLQVLKG